MRLKIILRMRLWSTKRMACDVLTGLLALYQFSNNGNDSSGNGNNLTMTSAAYTTDKNGVSNQARSYDGSTQYDATPSLNLGNQWAFCIWVNQTSTASGDTYFTGNSNNILFGFQIVSLAKVQFYVNVGGAITLDETSVITTGSWFHYVATSDGVNAYLYKNGVLQQSTACNKDLPNTVYLIGGDPGNKFAGTADEIRIYNAYLDQDSVTALYNGYDAPSCSVPSTGYANSVLRLSSFENINKLSRASVGRICNMA